MTDSPIETYLDELVLALAGRAPRELRTMLAEAEAHLRDAAEAAQAAGVPQRQAELDAVSRFGSADTLAAAERDRDRLSLRALLGQLARTGVLLGAIGAIAVGVSGVIAGCIRLVAGSGALVDVVPGQTLGPADCARWVGLRPELSCRAAAVADWADETVYYRIAVGVLGVLALLVYRRLRTRTTRAVATVRDAVGLTAFGLAMAATLVLGVDAARHGSGAGQWLSATVTALVGAGGFAVALGRDLRTA